MFQHRRPVGRRCVLGYIERNMFTSPPPPDQRRAKIIPCMYVPQLSINSLEIGNKIADGAVPLRVNLFGGTVIHKILMLGEVGARSMTVEGSSVRRWCA